MNIIKLLFLVSSSCYLVACQTPPHSSIPTETTPSFSGTIQWKNLPDQHTLYDSPQHFWQAFSDSTLEHLLTQVTLNHQNLQVKTAQYQIAQATLAQSQATNLPQLTANVGATYGVLSTNNNVPMPKTQTFSVGVSSSWEVDVWGRIRYDIEQKQALLSASLADLQAATLSVQALIAQTYIQLRLLDAQLHLLTQSIEALKKFHTLTQLRQQAGVATGLDVAQAETQLHTLQTQQLELQAQRATHEHHIATLSGVAPTQLTLSPTHNIPLRLPDIPEIIPSQLLMYRPDIQSAQHRMTAANAAIGYANTAFFPSMTLTANTNLRNNQLQELINLPNTLWSLGTTLATSLFDGGAREARSRIAQAQYQEALAHYRQTILEAFQEVEDGLSNAQLLKQAAQTQQKTTLAAEKTLRIAQSQYQAGTTTALTVINAQTNLWSSQQNALALYAKQLQAYVQLAKNIGNHLEKTKLNP